MSLRKILLLVTLVSLSTSAQTINKYDEIQGLWTVTSAVLKDGTKPDSKGKMELSFNKNKILTMVVVDPINGINSPTEMKGSYDIPQPNVVTYTFDGKTHERQTFSIKGDLMHFEHLDYGTKSELRRIKKSLFSEKPKIMRWSEIESKLAN